MNLSSRKDRGTRLLLVGLLVLGMSMGCGGAGKTGGAGPEGPGQSLVLTNFLQAGHDTVPINQVLEFQFSEAVDADTINSATIQIREGPTFGLAVAGTYSTDGATVYFEPVLPTVCDYSDGAFKPNTSYRVTLIGTPEGLGIANTRGQPLDETSLNEFRTLPDASPDLLRDQIPGEFPSVTAVSTDPGSAAVGLDDVTSLEVTFSENLDPCSIRMGETILLRAYERGDPTTFVEAPNGNESGFDPVEDALPEDPYTWGANGTLISPPLDIAAEAVLEQSLESTVLRIRPLAGAFPENLLIVLDLTVGIRDFGGDPLPRVWIDFTMENVDGFAGALTLEYDDTTPIDSNATSADVNTARSPGLAQAWLAFTGDGDNGAAPFTFPAFPILDAGTYSACGYELNDGEEDDLIVEGIVTLNTGSTVTPDTCINSTDGSSASVWEFRRVEVRPGGVLNLVGVNPAIFVVKQDVLISDGGTVNAFGGNGKNSAQGGFAANTNAGGVGRLGGGGGGKAPGTDNTGNPDRSNIPNKSWDGVAPYGSPDYELEGGTGAGEGGSSGRVTGTYCQTTGGGQGGGGGGHGEAGGDADDTEPSGSNWDRLDVGNGGDAVPSVDTKMRKPSAGGGAGGGGTESLYAQNSSGGGGGAGGGFVGFTAGGDILVHGKIDVRGGRGGFGGWDDDGPCNGSHSGGGGGGGGGGIRLLSGGDINLLGGVLTAAGGAAGQPGCTRGGATSWVGPLAGAGASGRIVLEDQDGLIAGTPDVMVPASGSAGFYSAQLDPTRFPTGGGAAGGAALAVTLPMPLGSIIDPTTVVFAPVVEEDLAAGIPAVASLGPGPASIVVELQGYSANPDGTLDDTSGTGWYVVGYFEVGPTENMPIWHSDVSSSGFPVDAGVGIDGVDGSVYVQVRTSLVLANDMTPTDPGPYVDRMTVRYTFDN